MIVWLVLICCSPMGVFTDLEQLNLIFRHGARAPLKHTYPNDPHQDYDYYPYGVEKLTKAGMIDGYHLGNLIRNRYNGFLGKYYNNSMFNLISDSSVRVQETALCAMAALWPPNESEEFLQGFPWQPVSYQLQEYYPDQDSGNEKDYMYVFDDKSFLSERFKPYEDIIPYILENAGLSNPLDIMWVWSTLRAQVNFNLTLPEWTEKIYPDILSEINYEIFAASAYTKELRQTLACGLLEIWITNMENYINNKSPVKSWFYGGHDDNIVVLLECLNLYHPPSPEYASNLALELLKEKGDYLVRVVYQRTLEHAPKVLRIPGCSHICTFNDFKNLMIDRNGFSFK